MGGLDRMVGTNSDQKGSLIFLISRSNREEGGVFCTFHAVVAKSNNFGHFCEATVLLTANVTSRSQEVQETIK